MCSHSLSLSLSLTHTHTHTHTHSLSRLGLTLVTIEQSPELLFETQSVTLTCLIGGVSSTDANYTWTRDGGVELTGSEGNVVLLGNQLTITNVSIAEWDGVCIACQAVAMTTMGSDSVNLTVTSKSLFIIYQQENHSFGNFLLKYKLAIYMSKFLEFLLFELVHLFCHSTFQLL